MYKFTHCGKSGDIIYSLYLVKLMGGGEYYITPSKIGMDYFKRLKPILEIQPYITNVEYTRTPPDDCINLNKFREIGNQLLKQHIIQSHIDAVNKFYNYSYKYTYMKWLDNIPKTEWKNDYIVIQRSTRYHAVFDYKQHIDSGLRIIFCGGKDEFNKFQTEYTDLAIEYYFPTDFLEFAKLIRNSRYFIGNQSVGSAIAQGLSHPQIQETHHKEHNCIPHDNLKYIFR